MHLKYADEFNRLVHEFITGVKVEGKDYQMSKGDEMAKAEEQEKEFEGVKKKMMEVMQGKEFNWDYLAKLKFQSETVRESLFLNIFIPS